MVRRLMDALIRHRQLDPVVRRIRNRQRLAGQRDLGTHRLVLHPVPAFGGRSQIGDKDAAPQRGTGSRRHVIDIQHRIVVRELLLEHLRLHFCRHVYGRSFIQQLVLGSDG